MRYSVDSADPGYEPYIELTARELKPIIFLNEERQSEVITVDEDEGLVLRYTGDDALDDEGALVTETLHGVVRIEYEPYP